MVENVGGEQIYYAVRSTMTNNLGLKRTSKNSGCELKRYPLLSGVRNDFDLGILGKHGSRSGALGVSGLSDT